MGSRFEPWRGHHQSVVSVQHQRQLLGRRGELGPQLASPVRAPAPEQVGRGDEDDPVGGRELGLGRAPSAIVAAILVGGALGAAVLLAGGSRRVTEPHGPAIAVGAYLTLLLSPP